MYTWKAGLCWITCSISGKVDEGIELGNGEIFRSPACKFQGSLNHHLTSTFGMDDPENSIREWNITLVIFPQLMEQMS